MNLIEKLEQKESEVSQMMQADEAPFPYHYMAGKLNAFREIVNIVKQHSDWVSVDERLPPNVTDEEKNYLLLIHKEWGCFIIGQYIKEDDEINSYMGNDPISDFAYWMPIPQPPSEVQA